MLNMETKKMMMSEKEMGVEIGDNMKTMMGKSMPPMGKSIPSKPFKSFKQPKRNFGLPKRKRMAM